jgi:hypothetical protein
MDQKQTRQEKQPNTAPNEEPRQLNNGGVTRSEAGRPGRAEKQVYRCANCDIEIFWPPTVVQDTVYCCTGCAAGGPCNCDYSLYRSVTIMGVIHYKQQ